MQKRQKIILIVVVVLLVLVIAYFFLMKFAHIHMDEKTSRYVFDSLIIVIVGLVSWNHWKGPKKKDAEK
jgi:hypothetical protein